MGDSVIKDFHDLSIEEQEVARPYMDLISLTSFMKMDSVDKFGDTVQEVMAARALPEEVDDYITKVIEARASIIAKMDEMINDPESLLYYYAEFDYAFDSDFNNDMDELKAKFETLSQMYISILKDKWDETDAKSTTPQITQIVSMDARLVYIINSISSIADSFNHN